MTTTTRNTAAIETNATDKMTTGACQATLGIMISMAGMVGVWGVACMISAVAQSGGILQMARAYMTAIGM